MLSAVAPTPCSLVDRPLLIATAIGCGQRQVEVRTAPASATQPSIQVTNNLTQAVNVYATAGGSDTFLRQVPANTSQTIPLQGFANGSTVNFKFVSVDGRNTYSRNNVTLSGTFAAAVP